MEAIPRTATRPNKRQNKRLLSKLNNMLGYTHYLQTLKESNTIPHFLNFSWSTNSMTKQYQRDTVNKILDLYIEHIKEEVSITDIPLSTNLNPSNSKTKLLFNNLEEAKPDSYPSINPRIYINANSLRYGNCELRRSFIRTLEEANMKLSESIYITPTSRPTPIEPTGTYFMNHRDPFYLILNRSRTCVIPDFTRDALQLGIDFCTPQKSLTVKQDSYKDTFSSFAHRLAWKIFFHNKNVNSAPSRKPNRFLPKSLRSRVKAAEPPSSYFDSIGTYFKKLYRMVSRKISNPNHPPESADKAVAKTRRWLVSENLVLKPADKGGSYVIMDRDYYRLAMNSTLADTTFFLTASTDALAKCIQSTNNLLDRLLSDGSITPKLKNMLKPQPDSRCPPIYGLPKIHKTGNLKFRPIVSGNGHPCEGISIFIDHLLQPLSNLGKHYLKDSSSLSHFLSKSTLDYSKAILFSLDVKSMYTMIPQEMMIDEVRTALTKSGLLWDERSVGFRKPNAQNICLLLRHVLENNLFEFDRVNYTQACGVAMGTPCACVVTDIFINQYIERLFSTQSRKPIIFKQYRDDSFGIWMGSSESLNNWVAKLNEGHPNIQFELSVDPLFNQIDFLDLSIKYDPISKKLTTETYYKPTRSNDYLNFQSTHPLNCRLGIAYSQTIRHLRNCSQHSTFLKHMAKLKQDLLDKGYPLKDILRYTQQTHFLKRPKHLKPKNRAPMTRVPIPIQFNSLSLPIQRAANRLALKYLKEDILEQLGGLPLIAYSQGQRISNSLVKAKF